MDISWHEVLKYMHQSTYIFQVMFHVNYTWNISDCIKYTLPLFCGFCLRGWIQVNLQFCICVLMNKLTEMEGISDQLYGRVLWGLEKNTKCRIFLSLASRNSWRLTRQSQILVRLEAFEKSRCLKDNIVTVSSQCPGSR